MELHSLLKTIDEEDNMLFCHLFASSVVSTRANSHVEVSELGMFNFLAHCPLVKFSVLI